MDTDTLRDFQRRAAEAQIAILEQSAEEARRYVAALEASPQWQEQEARRRAVAELRSLGEHEAAALVGDSRG